jgi:hypothetical protein
MSAAAQQTSTGAALTAVAVALWSPTVASNAAMGVGFQTSGAVTASQMLSGGAAYNDTSTGLTYSPGTKVWCRVRLAPVSATAWEASVRVWLDGSAEPTHLWHRTSSYSAFAARGIAVGWVGRTGNSNVSPQVRFDDFTLLNPQKVTVTRGANGVQRAWAVGSTVELWRPAVYAL